MGIRCFRPVIVADVLVNMLLFAPSSNVSAAALLVDTLHDDIPNDGFCSLRAAVEAANADADVGDEHSALGAPQRQTSSRSCQKRPPSKNQTDRLT